MTPTVVGIDLGTSGCKAGAFTLDGEQVGRGSAPCTVRRPRPGWVEQDPEEYWTSAVTAIRQAVRGVDPASVIALAVCGHTPSLVLVDDAGTPVRPAIVWQDSRAAAEAAALDAEVPAVEWREWLGMDLPRNASYPPARLRWLQRHEPAVLRRIRCALQPKDYLNFRLTGVMGSDYWSSKGLVHLQTGEPVTALADLVGLDHTLAPPCSYPHHLLGSLSPTPAGQIGLPAGIGVATGWSDAMAGMLGSGALAGSGLAFDIAGTSEIVGLTTHREPGRTDGVLVAPVLDTDLHIVYGPTQSSGGAVQWCLDTLYPDTPEADVDVLAAPDAEDLIFLPYLEGERAPIWDARARGVFFRISSTHTRAHFLRAVLEGVAFSVRHVLETAQQGTGIDVAEVRVCGGGQSHRRNALKAAVTGKPIRPALVSEGGTLGAAMLAALAAGRFAGIGEAGGAMVRLAPPIEPETRGKYDTRYREYLALYRAVRDLY